MSPTSSDHSNYDQIVWNIHSIPISFAQSYISGCITVSALFFLTILLSSFTNFQIIYKPSYHFAWPKRTTWLNIPVILPSFQIPRFTKNTSKIINTIGSIWFENMLKYLSLDITDLFLEAHTSSYAPRKPLASWNRSRPRTNIQIKAGDYFKYHIH